MTHAGNRHLVVAMNGVPVGHWMVEGGRHRFRYEVHWYESDEARPLSLSLPLLFPSDSHRGAVVERFFDNLLPDDRTLRDRMRRRYGARSTSAFDLLAEAGRDCVGAVQLLPPGTEAATPSPATGEPLDESGVAAALRTARTGVLPGSRESNGLRLSLAGAQEKTALLRLGNRWYEPSGATPTTHILKLPLGRVGAEGVDLSSSVQNEWFCLRLLALIGLPVARASIERFEDQTVLSVERFDRRTASDGRTLLRLPQEDTCQALGLSSDAKYEADGGPGTERLMALWAGSRTAEEDRYRFFETQVLFWLLAAPDGHAKNFSLFLERGNRYSMAPLYDVVSVWPYLGRSGMQRRKVRMAMAWTGKNRHYGLADIRPEHIASTAERCGFAARLPALVEELGREVPRALAAISSELDADFPRSISEPIAEGTSRSLTRLVDALGR